MHTAAAPLARAGTARVPAKRRVILVGAVLVAALVAAIVLVVVVVLRGGGQGPLVANEGAGDFGQPAAIGQLISVSGPLVVQNTSDHALELDKVEMVGLPRSMYRGAYVLPWPPAKVPFTAALTYRVPRGGQTIPGATIAPHAWAWIVIGLEVAEGRHQWSRVDLVYHDGGAVYRRRAYGVGVVCGSVQKYASCPVLGS